MQTANSKNLLFSFHVFNFTEMIIDTFKMIFFVSNVLLLHFMISMYQLFPTNFFVWKKKSTHHIFRKWFWRTGSCWIMRPYWKRGFRSQNPSWCYGPFHQWTVEIWRNSMLKFHGRKVRQVCCTWYKFPRWVRFKQEFWRNAWWFFCFFLGGGFSFCGIICKMSWLCLDTCWWRNSVDIVFCSKIT